MELQSHFPHCSLLQLESLPGLVQGVRSDDRNTQIEAVTQFRKLLSIGKRTLLSYIAAGCAVFLSQTSEVLI